MPSLLTLTVEGLLCFEGAHAFINAGTTHTLKGRVHSRCFNDEPAHRISAYSIPCSRPKLLAASPRVLNGDIRGILHGRPRRFTTIIMATDKGRDQLSTLEESARAEQKGLLKRIAARVIKTSRSVGKKAGSRIRRITDEWQSEDIHEDRLGEKSRASSLAAAPRKVSASMNPPTSAGVSKIGKAAGSVKRGEGSGETPRLSSALDVALRPLLAFTTGVQEQAEAVEEKLSRRVSDLEDGFNGERAMMGRTLEEQKRESQQKLREAEEQLQRLQTISVEKDRAEEAARKVKTEKEEATALFNEVASTLRKEANGLRERLEKERRSLSAAQAEALNTRVAQENERTAAQKRLTELMGELEKERQASAREQERLSAEAYEKANEQSRALKVAMEAATKADSERQQAEAAKAEAEAEIASAEAATAAVSADMAAAKARSEAELVTARGRIELAEADAAAARSASGMDALQNELALMTSELKEQRKRADAFEVAKTRVEREASTRSRGLEELMEKNRLRYGKRISALQDEIDELGLLKGAVERLEEIKTKLGFAESREQELVRETSELANQIKSLNKKMAEDKERSAADARLIEAKELALQQAEAQLRVANERADQLEKDSQRLPELQRLLDEASAERDAEHRRADKLKARDDEAAVKAELVKDRIFDLERSVEVSEWSERKLVKENESLQSMIKRNRARYDKEVAKLTEASADLVEKTASLEALEVAMAKECEVAEKLDKQVSDLKKQSAAMASELSKAKAMLAQETAKRMQAESALRQASESGYTERRHLNNEMAELATLRVTVADLESARRKEALKWDEERSSLASRLEKAMRSSEGYSTQISQLEQLVEKLRQEAGKTKKEAESVREQLGRVEASADSAGNERKRLEQELQDARASAAGVREENTRLQDRVASLMEALQKATKSMGAGIAPPSTLPPNTASGHEDVEVVDTQIAAGPGSEVEVMDASNRQQASAEPQPSYATKARKPRTSLLIRPWQVGAMPAGAGREAMSENQARANAETVSAIDDFLERAQDVVEVGTTQSDDDEGIKGGVELEDDAAEPRLRSWAPFSRWSKQS